MLFAAAILFLITYMTWEGLATTALPQQLDIFLFFQKLVLRSLMGQKHNQSAHL
jgi:TM2 domain-containing membrane protein YozV